MRRALWPPRPLRSSRRLLWRRAGMSLFTGQKTMCWPITSRGFPSSAEYRSFDSEGRLLELVADPPVRRRRLLGPIGIDDAHKSTLLLRALETEPSGESELVALLSEWLPMVGVPRDHLAD